MSVRLKRLAADYERVTRIFRESPYIHLKAVAGNPPEKYQIEYRVKGLVQRQGRVVEKNAHLVEIALTRAYPRQAPQCRMLTPVFHPNIAPHAICIGDHWTAGEALADLIVRIGEMIAYQSYNVKSPLNGEAARWADKNVDKLPIDSTDLTTDQRPEDIVVAAPGAAQSSAAALDACANCGAQGEGVALVKCVRGHTICENCSVSCGSCGKPLCLLCEPKACSRCGRLVCEACLHACGNCGKTMCGEHSLACAECGVSGCPDCTPTCSRCQAPFCLSHFNAAAEVCEQCYQQGSRDIVEFRFDCPSCSQSLSAKSSMSGRRGKCPKCGGAIVIPPPPTGDFFAR